MDNALRRKLFVGCRELGLDDDARRDLQLRVCGKASMSDMTDEDGLALLKELEHNGFKPSSNGRAKRPAAPSADLRLVHVLWRKLGEAGALQRPGRDGLNAFIRARFEVAWMVIPADVDMLRDPEKISQLIEALSAWGKRVGIDFDFNRRRR